MDLMKMPRLLVAACCITVFALLVMAQMSADEHEAAAKAASGDDWDGLLQFQCYGPGPVRADAAKAQPKAAPKGFAKGKGKGGPPPGPPAQETYYRAPAKVFDNLYFVGQSEYSAWAIVTSEGIILMDTLFDYSVEPQVVEGLRELGLDPADIKYAVVSHPHPDHHGGAKFLQEEFGTRIVMSPADWDVIETLNGSVPARDVEATDGMRLTLGDTTVTLYVTPGHTPGTLSSIFSVVDNGKTRMAGLWGGAGLNRDRDSVETYIASAQRFRELLRAADVEVILSNHTDWDRSKINLPRIAQVNASGQSLSPNPYVVGSGRVRNFMTVAEQCAQSRIN